MEEFAYVIAVVADTEFIRDKVGNTLRGPQFRTVPVRYCPFQQIRDKTLLLRPCQSSGPPGRGFGFQSTLAASVNGVRANA